MKNFKSVLRLYAVTDRSWTEKKSLLEQVEDALKGGVTCVQLREKDMDFDSFLAEATQMAALCHRYHVPLIINDQVEIALRSGADGVHVGQEDMQAGEVRALLGTDMIIGVTAKTVEQALRAQADGADYLGSGAVFGSATKLNARPMSFDTLHSICRAVSIPVVAIGGVNRENIQKLSHTGVCGAAVVSGIFAAPDILEECRLLRSLSDSLFGETD